VTNLFTGTDVTYRHSEPESRRFGLAVARMDVQFASDPVASLETVREQLDASRDDVIVLRYPSERVGWFASLRDGGWDVLHAGSLVHFERSLTEPLPPLPPGWPRPDLRLVGGDEVDQAALELLVLEVFARHESHYLANPLFDRPAVLAGYQEWVVRSLHTERVACVVASDGRPQGFLAFTCAPERSDQLIGGVAQAAQRQHVFHALFVEVARLAAEAGSLSVGGPTAVHNVATQRVYASAGYHARWASETVHLIRPGLLG